MVSDVAVNSGEHHVAPASLGVCPSGSGSGSRKSVSSIELSRFVRLHHHLALDTHCDSLSTRAGRPAMTTGLRRSQHYEPGAHGFSLISRKGCNTCCCRHRVPGRIGDRTLRRAVQDGAQGPASSWFSASGSVVNVGSITTRASKATCARHAGGACLRPPLAHHPTAVPSVKEPRGLK